MKVIQSILGGQSLKLKGRIGIVHRSIWSLLLPCLNNKGVMGFRIERVPRMGLVLVVLVQVVAI